jgi:thiol-disulfide isomerase/thioredoxin
LRYIVALLLFLLPSLLFAQDIIGRKTLQELKATNHQIWFDSNYQKYQPDIAVLQSLPKINEAIKVIIVGGTWCSDTRQYLPAFYKVLDVWKPEHLAVELIFVDRTKKLKEKDFKKLHITNVPTFIFYNAKGKEMGRIIETPKVDIENDLSQLLKKYSF